MTSDEHRRALLESFDAPERAIEELLHYNTNHFDHRHAEQLKTFPLDDEPFLATWEGYIEEARERGAFNVLKDKLVQFAFPIEEGISQSEDYRNATLMGDRVPFSPERGTLLAAPEQLELSLHQTPAGRIPVCRTPVREDFVRLVHVLATRNEPKPVPAALGAKQVVGYNNWDRVHAYKDRWAAENPEQDSDEEWDAEFESLIPRKELYQDRFILLSSGFYSATSPSVVGMDEEEWRAASLAIRLEHECTHYFTKRVLSSMRDNVLDELIADLMGLLAATGTYRANWLLHFLGLEDFPDYREGGRLEVYRGEPALSDDAFVVLQALTHRAALNLEQLNPHIAGVRSLEQKAQLILALASCTLEDFASERGVAALKQSLKSRL